MRIMRTAGQISMETLRVLMLGVISLSAVCDAAWANADAEREALERLMHEIEALKPLIKTAERRSSPDARIRFRYDWLRQDLQLVRAGIREHIDAPRSQPRTFPPLRGDYRR
jgi:RAQPRD family integrative conjugative element protein